MNITVYTKPDCVQCNATKRWFDRENIPYNTVDLTTDSEAMDKVVAMGYTQAPVVITDKDSWSGFRVSKIQEAIKEIKSEDAQKK